MNARSGSSWSSLRFAGSILLAAGLTACSGGGGEEGGDRALSGGTEFPVATAMSLSTTSAADFAGSEACASCHVAEYDAWAGSTHGQAGGEPGPDVVIAPFSGTAIRFSDATVIPRITGGRYEFLVRQDGHAEAVYSVDGVIGGAHMIGGGTQGFLTRQTDGTERFLPWDWSGGAEDWFCNTGSRTNQGWEPITSDMSLRDCGDWPPLRPIGTVDRFANCQECHGSQILTTVEPGAGYATEYTTLQVNCESCHGPAARHVDMAQADAFGPDGDIGVTSLAYLEKDESLGVCFQCHALKDVIKEGYLPGEDFEDYYALKFPVLGDQPYFADGRVRSFAYQGNHLASACYLQGPMDCVSCHEPHAQGYWDVNREALASPFDDGQCTSCHLSKADDVESHTFHPEGTEASKCVTCHMPYLQHPEVGDGVPFGRSDHTIANPRPVFDSDLGLTTACAQCHQDRSALQLQSEARAWWGDPKPHRPGINGLVGELRARNLGEAAALLLQSGEVDPLVQFQGLSRLVEGYLQPNSTSVPTEVVESLQALASGPDLDISALALAGLHWTLGDDPTVRADLVRHLEISTDDEALRGRWLLALGFLGDRARDRGDFTTSAIAYEKALEIRPGDARILHAQGQMFNRQGDYPRAIQALRSSLAVDPQQSLAWVNLGIAFADSGDPGAAREAYGEALQVNPWEAIAHYNLGNLERTADQLEAAARSYARAVEADPGLGLAHFELARTYILLERPAEALEPARRAVEFRPDHPGSRAMLNDLERLVGGTP